MVSIAAPEYRVGRRCNIIQDAQILVHAQIRNLERVRVEPDGRRTRRVLMSDNLHNETNIIKLL